MTARGWRGQGAPSPAAEAEQPDRAPRGLDPSEALAIAAHELRQPAGAIYGLAAMLANQRDALSGEEVDEVVARLHNQAERLVAVLDETLDLDRIRRTKAPPGLTTVDLASAVREALALVSPPEGVRVSVAIPEGLDVVATAPGLQRLLVNLLSNAYRYGGPRVCIKAAQSAELVRLCVADDGPGVPDDLVPHIFEPFRAQPGGHGLGLSIVLGLAESFGGSAAYLPANPGAEFEVTLQAGTARSHLDGAHAAPPAAGDPATVLVVDDESDMRWLLRSALESAGYRVLEAAHGLAALEAIRDRHPALVVSDLMMPVMDGNELSRRLRAQPGGADLPILVLSANPDLARDADCIMRKPCNIAELTRAVGELIRAGRGCAR